MNRFIELLEKGDDVSIKKLKQLFRILSKQVHPDIIPNSNESFIKLRNEYEDAYSILMSGSYKNKKTIEKDEARTELLKRLYHFYICIYSKRSYDVLGEIINYAEQYDKTVFELLIRYQNEMYLKMEYWKENPKIFYAHNVMVTGIMQFFECYNQQEKVPHQIAVNVYKGHRQSIEMWIGNSNEQYREILLQIHDWLELEIERPNFKYYGI